jgi:exopolyphosphatase / guanosine-5'-triphosphate,3'-diphosphate pyrophosphatase
VIKASIDIGTNSVLLLIADCNDNTLDPLHEFQEVPRLGKGVDKNRTLHSDSCDRVISVLLKYKKFISDTYPEILNQVVVTATSAVRDASNRAEFIKRVLNETGWGIKLLSGNDEAFTTFTGAVSVLDSESMGYVVLDIGGGSTEIARGKSGKMTEAVSIDMGSVRFSERFLKSNPPKKNQINDARVEVSRLLNGINPVNEKFEAVGVAGTVTSIAAIELGLNEYDAALINGYKLRREIIGDYISEFSRLTSDEIELGNPAFLTNRGDVILGGLLILDEFLEWCGKAEITVSTGGIRHGILLLE